MLVPARAKEDRQPDRSGAHTEGASTQSSMPAAFGAKTPAQAMQSNFVPVSLFFARDGVRKRFAPFAIRPEVMFTTPFRETIELDIYLNGPVTCRRKLLGSMLGDPLPFLVSLWEKVTVVKNRPEPLVRRSGVPRNPDIRDLGHKSSHAEMSPHESTTARSALSKIPV